MKMVKLYAYWAKNLGDDLMVHILLNRYPQYRFYCDDYDADEGFCKYPNFCCKEMLYKKYGRLNHLISILSLNKSNDGFFNWLFRSIEKRICCSIYIGGSLFMQREQTDIDKRLSFERKRLSEYPLYIIGANFGPYQTEEFHKAFETYFANCAGVTFRDKKSQELFRHLPHVSYAPDTVFNLKPICQQEKTDRVLISVLDVSRRPRIAQYADQYKHFIIDICKEITQSNRIPVLMSFCKKEGDEDAIFRIISDLPAEVRQKTDTFFYNGDINLALQQFQLAESVIATRFHAMILALCFEKPFFSISYNSKVKNVLDDIGIKAYCDISDISSVTPKEALDSMSEKVDIMTYRKEAEKQFLQFERFMADGK